MRGLSAASVGLRSHPIHAHSIDRRSTLAVKTSDSSDRSNGRMMLKLTTSLQLRS